ncbi:hypothetical protein [Enterovibrio norvegicus]|uniref:hypothetical protein n=1 Tax=Enterovibrio norvegicus TaxID=188144 RepID=UPI00352EFEC8
MKIYSLFFLAFLSSYAFAAELVDLRSWEQLGDQASGNWTVSSNGASVYQSINGHPTAWISNEEYSNRAFRGHIQVNANAGDDDYIGFIVGYNDDGFILFSWKKGATSAPGGWTLVKVKGTLATLKGLGWAPSHRDGPNIEVLASNHVASGTSKGWKHGVKYPFELIYTSNYIKASMGGNVFEIDGEFQAGKAGFFNWSQGGVTYHSIAQLYPPAVEDRSVVGYQGGTITIQGQYTDQNQDETHTCSIHTQPQKGYVAFIPPCSFEYFAPPHASGHDLFRYKVLDSGYVSAQGVVAVDIDPSGAQPQMPGSVRANSPVFIKVNPSKSSGVYSDIRIRNLPAWASYDHEKREIRGEPDDSAIGIQRGIEIIASSDEVSHVFGPYDLKVLPANSFNEFDDHLEVFDHVVLDGGDVRLSSIDIPVIISDEGRPISGEHDATLHLDSESPRPVSFQNVDLQPGETVQFVVDLAPEGSKLPIEVDLDAGQSIEYRFELLNVRAIDDPTLLSVEVCSEIVGEGCSPALQFHRTKVRENEVMGLILAPDLSVKATLTATHQQMHEALPQFFAKYQQSDHIILALNGASGLGNAIATQLVTAPAEIQSVYMEQKSVLNAGGALVVMLSGQEIAIQKVALNNSWPLDIKKWLYQNSTLR